MSGMTVCECDSAETGLLCYCCVTCGSAWCDWFGEHPPEHTCNHRWMPGERPDDSEASDIHSCARRSGHTDSHECKCRAILQAGGSASGLPAGETPGESGCGKHMIEGTSQ